MSDSIPNYRRKADLIADGLFYLLIAAVSGFLLIYVALCSNFGVRDVYQAIFVGTIACAGLGIGTLWLWLNVEVPVRDQWGDICEYQKAWVVLRMAEQSRDGDAS